MKKLTILLFSILVANSFGFSSKYMEGKLYVSPSIIDVTHFVPSSSVAQYCELADRYIENFRGSYVSNNCSESDAKVCKTIKRIYKKIAFEEGSLGTTLPAVIPFSLGEVNYQDVDLRIISKKVGKDIDQLEKTSEHRIAHFSIVEIKDLDLGSSFSFAQEAIGEIHSAEIDMSTLSFSNRLSACAFTEGSLSLYGKADIVSKGVDNIPLTVFRYFSDLKQFLHSTFLKYPSLNNIRSKSHNRAFDLIQFGLLLAAYEKKVEDNEIFQKFTKIVSFKNMQSWWRVFFLSEENSGRVLFKEYSDSDLKKLYKEPIHFIKSMTSFKFSMKKESNE